MGTTKLKITIRDRNLELINELNKIYNTMYTAEVADVFKEPASAFVSPANSFGYMDGGIDLHYCNTIGWHLQENLQKKIKEVCLFKEIHLDR